MVHILASIPVRSVKEAVRDARNALVSGADLVEFRMDYLPLLDPGDIDRILACVPPERCTFTVRRVSEGGIHDHANRMDVLMRATEMRVRYVDVEADAPDLPQILGDKGWIISRHGDIAYASRLVEDAAAHPDAEMVKGAFTVSSLSDVARLVSLARELRSKGVRFTLSGMGDLGQFSRYILPLYGSALAYTHVGRSTAPGQVELTLFRRVMDAFRPSEPEGILCLLGRNIGYTVSPQMHNAALSASGLNWVYVPLDIEDDKLSVLDEVRLGVDIPIRGMNVTIPYKEAVRERMDSFTREAEAVGAVNTVSVRNGRLLGANTDAQAVVDALLSRMRAEGVSSLCGCRVLVLGAGGAARAAVYGMMSAGAEVYICNRTRSRAESLAREFGASGGYGLSAAEMVAGKVDVILNCTPVTASGGMPLPATAFLPRHTVMDMVYKPLKTAMLKAAASRGAATVGGVHMLVRQAVASFMLWTGLRPDADLMLRSAVASLASG